MHLSLVKIPQALLKISCLQGFNAYTQTTDQNHNPSGHTSCEAKLTIISAKMELANTNRKTERKY